MNVNFPGWWLVQGRVQALDPGLFKVLVFLLRYAVEERTDGHLQDYVLSRLPRSVGTDTDLTALANEGFLTRSDKEGYKYYLTDYDKTQSSAQELEARAEHARKLNRDRQARYRQKAKEEEAKEKFLPKELEQNYSPPGYDPSASWATTAPGRQGG